MNPPQVKLEILGPDDIPVTVDISEEGIGELSLSLQITDDEFDTVGLANAVDTSVSLLSTANTEKIFRYYGHPNVRAEAAEPKKQMLLQVNGTPILSGYAALKSAGLNHNGFELISDKYSVQLFGGNAAWFTKLEDTLLSDFDYSIYDQIQNDSNVLAGTQAEYGVLNFGYCLIKYGSQWKAKTGGGTGLPDLSEFTRFVYYKYLLDLIQYEVGVRFESEFFETDWFKTLIMPLPPQSFLSGSFAEDYLNLTVGDFDIVPPNSIVVFDYATVVPLVGPAYINYSNGKITIPYKGLYNFSYSTTFTFPPPPSPSSFGAMGAIALYKNGVILTGSQVEVFSANAPGFPPPDVSASMSFPVELNPGDEITVRTVHYFPLAFTGSAKETTLQITGEVYVDYGAANQPNYPKYLFRDYSCKDLIKGLTQLFNLKWQANQSGTVVYVEPANDYNYSYRMSGPATPIVKQGFYVANPTGTIGDRIALDAPAQIETKAYMPFIDIYKYKPDPNDEYAKSNSKEQLPILSCKVIGQQGAVERATTKENAFFAATAQIYDPEATYFAGATGNTIANGIQVPLMLQGTGVKAQDKFNFLPRILVFRREPNWDNDGYLRYTTGQNIANETFMRYPIAYVCNFQDTTNSDMSLALGNTQIINNLALGLVARFYKEYYGARMATRKILNAYFFLKLHEVQNFDFRKKLRYGSLDYRVISINSYSVINPEVPTELTLEPDPFQRFDIVGQIFTTPLSPIVS